jgi:hypothetical protein
MIIYLHCSNNKLSGTVKGLFKKAVNTYGWPSRVRGDWGTENNDIKQQMVAHRGAQHRPYLWGRFVKTMTSNYLNLIFLRSTQNVRIERLWRDVRKEALEFFQQLFAYLESKGGHGESNPQGLPLHCLSTNDTARAGLDGGLMEFAQA